MDMSEVEGSCLVIVEVEVNEYEGSVVLNDAEVDEVNEDGNLDDMKFDCNLVLDKSEVVIAVEVLGVLGEAEVDEVGNLVDSVVSVVLVKSEVELSVSVVLVFDSDDNGEFVEKLVC